MLHSWGGSDPHRKSLVFNVKWMQLLFKTFSQSQSQETLPWRTLALTVKHHYSTKHILKSSVNKISREWESLLWYLPHLKCFMKTFDCLGIFELEILPLKPYAMSALRGSYRFALVFHAPSSWCYSVLPEHIFCSSNITCWQCLTLGLIFPKEYFSKYFVWLYY